MLHIYAADLVRGRNGALQVLGDRTQAPSGMGYALENRIVLSRAFPNVYRDTRVWRGDDGRYYCRKQDGTTGLLVGAAVGGLLGREVAGRGGDRTLGAILGAAGGALLGRSIDRRDTHCR